MKLCKVCNVEKDESEFLKDKSRKGGIRGKCLDCSRNYIRGWTEKNVDVLKPKRAKYYMRKERILNDN